MNDGGGYTQEQDRAIMANLERERKRLTLEYMDQIEEADDAYRKDWHNWAIPVVFGATTAGLVWAGTILAGSLGLVMAVIVALVIAWALME